MKPSLSKPIRCRRCQQCWTVDLARLGKPEQTLYRSHERLRLEVFRLVCPFCGNVEMLEVTFEEGRDA